MKSKSILLGLTFVFSQTVFSQQIRSHKNLVPPVPSYAYLDIGSDVLEGIDQNSLFLGVGLRDNSVETGTSRFSGRITRRELRLQGLGGMTFGQGSRTEGTFFTLPILSVDVGMSFKPEVDLEEDAIESNEVIAFKGRVLGVGLLRATEGNRLVLRVMPEVQARTRRIDANGEGEQDIEDLSLSLFSEVAYTKKGLLVELGCSLSLAATSRSYKFDPSGSYLGEEKGSGINGPKTCDARIEKTLMDSGLLENVSFIVEGENLIHPNWDGYSQELLDYAPNASKLHELEAKLNLGFRIHLGNHP